VFVILSYDVGAKRAKRALKICRKYLHHVHRSVFEGEITEGKLKALKRELGQIIDVRHDAVCVYRVAAPKFVFKDQIGVVEDFGEVI
jgi:CRISPR-associated protein Cas2